jgi:hypothetical protein
MSEKLVNDRLLDMIRQLRAIGNCKVGGPKHREGFNQVFDSHLAVILKELNNQRGQQ